MKILKYILLITALFLITRIIAQPEAPKNLVAQTVVDSMLGIELIAVKLKWDFVKDSHGNNVPIYDIYRKEGGLSSPNNFELYNKSYWKNTFFDFNVILNTTYSYYVVAKVNRMNDSANVSSPSSIVEINVGTNPVSIEKGTIAGTVTDENNGMALAGVPVLLFAANSFDMQVVLTDSDGKYSAKVYPGNYYVQFIVSGYLTEYYNNVEHIWEATDIDVQDGDVFESIDAALTPIDKIERFTISGNVSDSDGNNLNMARVEIITAKGIGDFLHRKHVLTDAEGNYSIKVREGSVVTLYAKAKNKIYYGEFYNNSSSMDNAEKIVVNGNIENIDFILETKPEASSSIAGSIVNSNNEPLQVMVRAIKLGSLRKDRLSNIRTFSIEDGSYKLEKLLPGNYILFVIPEKGYLPTFYNAEGLSTHKWRKADILRISENEELNNINFVLESQPINPTIGFAELSGLVKDFEGKPVVEALISIYNANGKFTKYAFSDLEGIFKMTGLQQGNYTVKCSNYALSSEVNNNVFINYEEIAISNFELSDDPYIATGISDIELPTEYKLAQNYPNPFNPTTTINYSIPIVETQHAVSIQLTIYDILGSKITTLVNKKQSPGNYEIQFNASNLPSGLYIYQLKANNFLQSKKMLLLK